MRAHHFNGGTVSGSRGSRGRKSVGVVSGSAGLPPTHVGGYRGGWGRRLGVCAILTENGQETVRFTSMNNQATKYTFRVRQAS